MKSRYIDNFDYSSRFRILKGGKISLVVSALLASVTLSFASPVGEQIVSGNVAIDRTTPNTTNITQSTNKSIINWQSFNVAGNETVNFNMPSSTSSSLNRVVGNNKSEIYGKINSNGQVFLVNQNGIYFSKDAQVNTAGFVASTQNITDENFLNSNYIFEGNSDASIINLGTITTPNAYTALLAKKVENEGVIKAHLGSVQLASGEKFTLDINGNSLVKLTIDKGTLDGLVANKGAIIADGGEIYLTTSALDTVLNGLVNNTGIIQANSVEEKDGKIILFAHGGTGEFGGSIEAVGGFVETSGKEFLNKADLKVKASHWLIDPNDITIDATLAGTISTSLESGDVTVDTTTSGVAGNGDIFVNSAITKAAGNEVTLTLKAQRDIIINDSISISSAADKLNTILWSNSDATNGGYIYMKNGSSITTNGGHLWMGGGSGTTTWNGLSVGDGYAIGTSAGVDLTNTTLGITSDAHYGTGNRFHYNGITLLNSNINTSGGDFKASGKSHNAQVTTSKAYIGVFIGGDYQVSTSTGDIVLDGISAVSANDNSWYNGVALGSANVAGDANPQLITTDGDIIITGEVNQNFNVGHPRAISMAVWGATNKLNLKTTSGDISLTGNNKSTVSNSANRAIGNDVDGYRFTEISSSTGNINITGIGANTGGYDIGFKNAIIKTDGTITFIGDTLNILTSYSTGSQISSVTNGIGSLIIKPYTASTTIGIGGAAGTLALASSYFSTNFVDGFSGITIGSSDQTGAIAIGATAIRDALTLYAQGSVTQSGAITGNQNLNLLGTNGIYTLNNTANNINTLTANTGSVTYIDSDALTLGAITATGVVNVATQTGNMTLNGNIATTDTTSSAITLNAGKNTAAGTSTGGNIIHTSGTITTGTNGRATLYSGSISGSTGLTTLIGSGSGNFRYNSDETSTNYTTVLSSGSYAVYRERPTITVTAGNKSKTYDGFSYFGINSVTTSGYVNNDTSAILSGSISYLINSGNTTINAGTYSITPSGYTNGLGYGISFIEGTLTINKANAIVTANSDTKTYNGEAQSVSGFTVNGLVNGETTSVLDGISGDNAIGTNVGMYHTRLSGTDENYNLTFVDGTLEIIDNYTDIVNSLIRTIETGIVANQSTSKTYAVEDIPILEALELSISDNLFLSQIDELNTPQEQNTKLQEENLLLNDIPLEQKQELLSEAQESVKEMVQNEVIQQVEKTQQTLNESATTVQNKLEITEPNQIEPMTQIAQTTNLEVPNQTETPKNQNDSIIQAQSSQNTQTSQNQNNITQNLSTSQGLKESLQTYEKELADQGFNKTESQTIANAMLKTFLSNPNGAATTVEDMMQAMKIDKESPNSALANGTIENKGSLFNQTLQNLLAKGIDPKEAYVTALEASNRQVPTEISISKRFTTLSDIQGKLALNLIAKGYSTSEAFEIAQKTSFPKESLKSQIVSGEISKEYDYLGSYLGKYPIDEALKLALQTKAQKEKYKKIDANNVELAFSHNVKNGTVPNSLLFEKALVNELRTNSFAVAYQNALQKVEKAKQHKPSPTESLSNGELKKNLTNGEKIWWIEFTKQTLNNKSQKEAILFANSAQKNYEKKMEKVKLAENKLKGKK